MAKPIVNRPNIKKPAGPPKKPAALSTDKMRAMARKPLPPGKPVGPMGPYTPGLVAQPRVGTWLQGSPVMVEGQTSLAAVVRAKKDSYLVDDGMQVAGDYTDAIRAQAGGGIQYPSMPDVGYAAASYNYPSAKMRTGAALGVAPNVRPKASQFTQTRKPLPTASFSPGLSKRAPPPAMRTTQANVAPKKVPGSNIRANVPAKTPPMRIPGRDYGVIETSPSEARRAVLATLMGLGDIPFNADPFTLLYQALQANNDFKTNAPGAYNQIMGMLTALIPTEMNPASAEEAALIRDAKCAAPNITGLIQVFQSKGSPAGNKDATTKQVMLCWRELLKAGARDLIQKNILARNIDLDAMPFADQIRANVTNGKSINQAVNEWLVSWAPTDWASVLSGIKLFPLDLSALGIRIGMLKYLYSQQYGSEIKSQWLDSLSNELANKDDNSISGAVDLIRSKAYKPDASPPPNVQLRAGVAPPIMSGPAAAPIPGASGAAASGSSGGSSYSAGTYDLNTYSKTSTTTTEPDNTLLYAGAAAAVLLIGAGVMMKMR